MKTFYIKSFHCNPKTPLLVKMPNSSRVRETLAAHCDLHSEPDKAGISEVSGERKPPQRHRCGCEFSTVRRRPPCLACRLVCFVFFITRGDQADTLAARTGEPRLLRTAKSAVHITTRPKKVCVHNVCFQSLSKGFEEVLRFRSLRAHFCLCPVPKIFYKLWKRLSLAPDVNGTSSFHEIGTNLKEI